MRRVEFSAFGEPAEVLRVTEVPEPDVPAGKVRIRLTHRPINPSDMSTVRGLYGRLPKLPGTPGLEGMGVIDALGEGVSKWQVGQRVVPLGIPGTWQEMIIAGATAVLPVPKEVSDQTAAQFVVNPVTAWVMLTAELGLEAGDWVLQTAAGSTLGRVVLQIAVLKGYRTVNFVRRREQVSELLDLGADVVVCTADEDVVDQVFAATDGTGVKGAIEAVGGETGALALSCLRPGGRMLAYGRLSGKTIPVNSGELIFRGTAIQGFWLSTWFAQKPAHVVQATADELMQLMAAGHLIPPVEAEYDLADVIQATAHSERPGRQGKVILTG